MPFSASVREILSVKYVILGCYLFTTAFVDCDVDSRALLTRAAEKLAENLDTQLVHGKSLKHRPCLTKAINQSSNHD